MLTRQQLELGIIRCAERWPDRVGLFNRAWDKHGNTCIMGRIVLDAGFVPSEVEFKPGGIDGSKTVHAEGWDLADRVVRLNNLGVRWGAIPKLLGIVPGETPELAPVPEEVAVV